MEVWKARFFYNIVKAVVLNHNLALLKKTIEKETEFPDVRATLVAVYNIYSADPDLMCIYYTAQKRLMSGDYESKSEEEALKVLFHIAEEVIKKAEAAATK